MKSFNKYGSIALITIGVATVLYFSTKNLTESPPVWMDEGIIIQTARNFSNSGYFGIRIDPETVVSAGFATTGYSVTIPISMMFTVVGIDLLNARMVMVIYLLLLVAVSIFWLKKIRNVDNWTLALSLLLIASFPPLYGHGKNVMGEVPGLFFLFASLIFLHYIFDGYKKNTITDAKKYFLISTFSLLMGFTVITKPIYILFIPAVFFAIILFLYKMRLFTSVLIWKNIHPILIGIVIFLGTIFVWASLQFHGETLTDTLSLYANPHSVDIIKSIFANLFRFLSEGQPVYTLLLLVIWSVAILFRVGQDKTISISEYVLWIFTFLVMVTYLRTIGYYRYFFPAEFIALIMLVPNLRFFCKNTYSHSVVTFLCISLIAFQGYTLIYSGWTARYRDSNQTAQLEEYFGKIGADKEIFIYQAPELTTFIKNENYSQFMDITPTIQVGLNSLARIEFGIPDIIAINNNDEIVNLIQLIGRNKYRQDIIIGEYLFYRKVSDFR